MPNLQINARMDAVVGAEDKGFEVAGRTKTVGNAAHDKCLKVVGGGSAVVLYDAAVDLATFSAGFVVVDPDLIAPTVGQEVDIELTINGVAHLQRRDSNVPVLLGKSAQATGGLTKVRALPKSGGATPTNDVFVRCCLYE